MQQPANCEALFQTSPRNWRGAWDIGFIGAEPQRAEEYLREFVADIKASGLVARLIERHGAKGVNVAP